MPIKHKGSFKNTERFLNKVKKIKIKEILEKYGSEGISTLSNATPKDTGLTALSWEYRIELTPWGYGLTWYNTNIQNGANIALLLQYGHGTGTGGYVQGTDYINPTMKPIFDSIRDNIWKEVSAL